MKYLVFACVLLAMASSLWTSSASASSGLPYGTAGLTHGSTSTGARSSAPNSIAYTVTTNHGAQGLPGYHLYSSQATPTTTRRKFRSSRRPFYNSYNNNYYYDPINSYVPPQHYYAESYYPHSYYNPYDNYPYYYY